MPHIHHVTHDVDHIGWPAAGESVQVSADIAPPPFPVDLQAEIAWTGSAWWLEALVTPEGGGAPVNSGQAVPGMVLVNCPKSDVDGSGNWPGSWTLTVSVSDNDVTGLGFDTSAYAGVRLHAVAFAFTSLSGD